MKASSDLQEDRETRYYIIKHNDELLEVVEDFYFYNKRGAVFPAQYARCGRQHVKIQTRGGYVICEYAVPNVYESTSHRKRLIYSFLRRRFTRANPFGTYHDIFLKDCQCVIKDRLKCDGYNNTLEFIEAQFNRAEHVIAHSTAAEDGIHITFKHPINEEKQKEILKALNADNNVNFCKFTDNKVLFINITPAP